MILGLDTATSASCAAVLAPDGRAREARDDPAPGERPRHSERLLELVEEVVEDWTAIRRIAVGIGPGGFTGLRIAIATARALAQARGVELAGVSTLAALAAAADAAAGEREVLAVIDARRGEAFAAAYAGGQAVTPAAALAPEALGGLAAGRLAVGDGAVRFRAQLQAAGATVPPDDDPLNRVSAVAICRLGAAAGPVDRDGLVPDYVRAPDAQPPKRQP